MISLKTSRIVVRVILFLLLNIGAQVAAQSQQRTYNFHFLGEFLYPMEFGLIQFKSDNETTIELSNDLFDGTILKIQKISLPAGKYELFLKAEMTPVSEDFSFKVTVTKDTPKNIYVFTQPSLRTLEIVEPTKDEIETFRKNQKVLKRLKRKAKHGKVLLIGIESYQLHIN